MGGVVQPCGEADIYRWCHSCEIWRPPNVSHCSQCRRCFWRFDHHCMVIGNCVAAYNHRFFALMLVSGTMAWMVGLVTVAERFYLHGALSSSDLWWPLDMQQ